MVSAAFMNMAIGATKQFAAEYNDKRKANLETDQTLIKQANEARLIKERLEAEYALKAKEAEKDFEYNMQLTGQKIESNEKLGFAKLDTSLALQEARTTGDIKKMLLDKDTLDKTSSVVATLNNDTRMQVARISSDTSLQINSNNIEANYSLASQKATDEMKKLYVSAGIRRDEREDTQQFQSDLQDARLKAQATLQDTKIQAGKDLQETKLNFETWKVNQTNATDVLIQGTAAERQDWEQANQKLKQAWQSKENDKRIDAQVLRQDFMMALSDREHINDMEKLEAIQKFDEKMKNVDFTNKIEVMKFQTELTKDIDNNRIKSRYDREMQLEELKSKFSGLQFNEASIGGLFSSGGESSSIRERLASSVPQELTKYISEEDWNKASEVYKSKLRMPKNGSVQPYIAAGVSAAGDYLIKAAQANRDADLNKTKSEAEQVKAERDKTLIDADLAKMFSVDTTQKWKDTDVPKLTGEATPLEMQLLLVGSHKGTLAPINTTNMLNDALNYYRATPKMYDIVKQRKIAESQIHVPMAALFQNLNFLRYAQYKDQEGIGANVVISEKDKKNAFEEIMRQDAALDELFGRTPGTIEAFNAIKDDKLRAQVKEVLSPYMDTSKTIPSEIESSDLPPVKPVVIQPFYTDSKGNRVDLNPDKLQQANNPSKVRLATGELVNVTYP